MTESNLKLCSMELQDKLMDHELLQLQVQQLTQDVEAERLGREEVEQQLHEAIKEQERLGASTCGCWGMRVGMQMRLAEDLLLSCMKQRSRSRSSKLAGLNIRGVQRCESAVLDMMCQLGAVERAKLAAERASWEDHSQQVCQQAQKQQDEHAALAAAKVDTLHGCESVCQEQQSIAWAERCTAMVDF